VQREARRVAELAAAAVIAAASGGGDTGEYPQVTPRSEGNGTVEAGRDDAGRDDAGRDGPDRGDAGRGAGREAARGSRRDAGRDSGRDSARESAHESAGGKVDTTKPTEGNGHGRQGIPAQRDRQPVHHSPK
jgi:hypothetical protein